MTPDEILELGRQLMESLRGLHWRDLLPLRLTMPQVKVLHVLSRCGRVSAGELADILGVSAPTVSDLVERMASMGLVQRERGQTDRRVVHLSLTPAGEETLRRVRQEHWAFLRELLEDMSPPDRDALGRGLRALWKVAERHALREAGDRPARRRPERAEAGAGGPAGSGGQAGGGSERGGPH